VSKNERIKKLEDKFEFPFTNLEDSFFEKWVDTRVRQGQEPRSCYCAENFDGITEEFDLLLAYLGLEIEETGLRVVKKKKK
jgi:hypothetical protein